MGEEQQNKMPGPDAIDIVGTCSVCSKSLTQDDPPHNYNGTVICSPECLGEFVRQTIDRHTQELENIDEWTSREFNLADDVSITQFDEVTLARAELEKIHQKWSDKHLPDGASLEDRTKFIGEMFTDQGAADGKLIAAIARKLHPDAAGIIALYRSAVCLMPGGRLICYHDPGWMGEERTEEILPRYCAVYDLHGSRSSVDIYVGDIPLQTRDEFVSIIECLQDEVDSLKKALTLIGSECECAISSRIANKALNEELLDDEDTHFK